MMVSLPSPPISTSLPSPPVMVSLPAPPSTVSEISGARPLPAVKVSSPPFMLTTRFSVVPMSRENGAGVTRSKRTRVPLAVTVKVSAPLPPLTSTVSMPSPPSLRSRALAGVPDHQVVAGLAEDLVVAGAAGQGVVAVAAEQQIVAALAQQGVVAGLAEEHVVARAADQGVVAVAAEEVRATAAPRWSRRARSCRCRPGRRPGSARCWRRWPCRPGSRTAPLLTRIVPAASRLTTIVLLAESPRIVNRSTAGEKIAETVGITRSSSTSKPVRRAALRFRRERRRSRHLRWRLNMVWSPNRWKTRTPAVAPSLTWSRVPVVFSGPYGRPARGLQLWT